MNKSPDDQPTLTGSAARPALVPRRGLFVTLLIVFIGWMSALVAMAIQLHRHHP